MPRLQKRLPKYGRHKASGQACVYVNGREVYLGKHGSAKSHERYQAFLAKWRASQADQLEAVAAQETEEALARSMSPAVLRRRRREVGVVTLDELIFAYRRHAQSYYMKNGKVTREADLIEDVTTPLGARYGDGSVDDFGPVDLEQFRETLIFEHDWSRMVINKQIGRVIRMFKWGVAKEICAADVPLKLAALGGLKRGRSDARETPGVSPVEDDRVNATIPRLPPIVADMVRFQRLTGARPGEICSLRPCDIDRRGDIWVYTPDSHKTEHHQKSRQVYVGPQAQAVLAPYLLRDAELYCFSPEESVERARQLQQRNRDKPWKRQATPAKRPPALRYQVASYRVAIRRGCTKAGVAVWTPNQLRHTAATEVRQKFGVEAAQVICGHERADVTQVYAERDRQLAEKVARAVG